MIKNQEKIVLSPAELDDGSAVINFDMADVDGVITHQSGYILVRHDLGDACFYVSVIGSDGSVISETVSPFNFLEV